MAHTAGEGNLGSDDASRGKFDLLAKYCSQVGTRARRVELPPAVEGFVAKVWAAVDGS